MELSHKTTSTRRGLLFSIYKHSDFAMCSNGGATQGASMGVLVGPGIPEIFPETEERPAFRLEKHYPGCARLIPINIPAGKAGPMFGGAFGHTSDARFTEAVEDCLGQQFYGAVAIHDRFE